MKTIYILIIGLFSAITALSQEICQLEVENCKLAENIFRTQTINENFNGNSYVCNLSIMSDERFYALCDRFEYNPNFENAKRNNPNMSIYVMYAKNSKGETNVFCVDLDCKTTLAQGSFKNFKWWTPVDYKGKQATHFKCSNDIIASMKSYLSMHSDKSLEGTREYQRMIEEVFQCSIGDLNKNQELSGKQTSVENRISQVEKSFAYKAKYVEGVLLINKNLSNDVRQQFENYLNDAKKYSNDAKTKGIEAEKEMKKSEAEKCDKCREKIIASTKELEKTESEMAAKLKDLKKYL